VTNWLVSTPNDGEGSFETDDEGISHLAARIIRDADKMRDGDYYIIRKADYLKINTRTTDMKRDRWLYVV
jgi:hypothetical protein